MKKKYYKNHIIQKQWSQIFLKDQNVINSIINILNPKKHQIIVEIGPGLGALTQPISKLVNSLTLIEIDTNLIHILNRTLHNKQLIIFNQDVMTINFFKLLTHPTQKLRLIGNLPYHISTKIIIHLFKYINIIQDMHFMIQKEVGQRILAQPNNKKYGRLSVITQYYFQVFPLLEISRTSFIPVPQVDSIMIRFIPYHNHSPYPIVDVKILSLLTQFAFQQRRKMIKNSLSSLFNIKDIIQHNIDIHLRSENLNIQQFCALATTLYNKSKQD